MRRISVWVVLLVMGALVVGCGGGAKTGEGSAAPSTPASSDAPTGTSAPAAAQSLKVSMVVSNESSWFQGAKRFQDLVEQRSNGKVTVSLHPDGELAGKSQAKELQMLGDGEIDMAIISDLIMSATEIKVSAISLPWLFRNYADVDKFRTSPVAQEMLDMLKSHSIVGLAWGENGFRQLTNSKHPVTGPQDLTDLNIRIPNVKLYVSTWKALGKEPAIVNWGDVPAKIKSGVIDGQENPIDTIMSAKLYDIQNQISVWNYSYDGLIFGMSQKSWEKFDAATQDIIRQSAKEAANYQVQLSRGVALSQLSFLKDKGMTVTEVTPEAIEAFRAKVAPVYNEFEEVFGKDLITKLRALSA